MCLFELEFSSFLDICQERGLLDHLVALFLVFYGNCILFSSCTNLLSHQQCRNPFSSHPLLTLLCVDFLSLHFLIPPFRGQVSPSVSPSYVSASFIELAAYFYFNDL